MKIFLLIAAMATSSCSAADYKTYGINADQTGAVISYLAKEPKDDLPPSVCAPRANVQFPCRMIEVDEYAKALRDLAELNERLRACEKDR